MNNGILFVDDEPNVVQGIRRMLFPYRNEWRLFYALGADEAMKVLENEDISIIVTDMRMPKVDGAQLLAMVKENNPGVIRVILTGQSDKEKMIIASNLAHRCMHKPYGADELISNLQELLRWKKDVDDANLGNIAQQLGDLPVLPKVYLELQEELNSSEVSIQKIVKIISTEPMIVAKLLQLVNSSFFGLPIKITNLMHAINYIGVSIIRTLVLYTKLFSTMKLTSENQLFIESVWAHSIEVANLSMQILRTENANKSDIEDAYIAGILHDIGKAFLTQAPIDISYSGLKDFSSSFEYIKSEQEMLGTDHTIVGSFILGLWGFKDEIVDAVRKHHVIDLKTQEKKIICDVVSVANVIVSNYEDDFINLEAKYTSTQIDKWKNLYKKKENESET